MAFTFACSNRGTHWLVRFEGVAFPDQVFAAVARLAEQVRECGARRLVVDFRAAVGALSWMEHRELGSAAPRLFPNIEKLAVLFTREQVTQRGAAVARKLGMDVRVFTDPQGAVRWIAEDAAAPPREHLPPPQVRHAEAAAR